MNQTVKPAPAPVEWVRPLAGYVVVLPLNEKRVGTGDDALRSSEGGVLLPDIVELEPIEAVVVALGEGSGEPISSRLATALAITAIAYFREAYPAVEAWPPAINDLFGLERELKAAASQVKVPFDVKVGDKVLFEPWHATVVILDEVEHHIVTEEHILGLVE